MKKFFIFLMCLSLAVLVSCGGSENSGGEEAASGKKGGESGCTTSKSIGTNSLTAKELSEPEIHDSCVKEIADAYYPACSWQNDEQKAAQHIAKIENLGIQFGRSDCTDPDTNETVECPDFIPTFLNLQSLAGCEVYSIDLDSDCIAPCADLYFTTGDKNFPKVYVGANFDDKNFVKGDNGTISFTSDFNPGQDNEAVFTWTEKAGDGSETVKKVTLSATVRPEPDDITEDCFWTRCTH